MAYSFKVVIVHCSYTPYSILEHFFPLLIYGKILYFYWQSIDQNVFTFTILIFSLRYFEVFLAISFKKKLTKAFLWSYLSYMFNKILIWFLILLGDFWKVQYLRDNARPKWRLYLEVRGCVFHWVVSSFWSIFWLTSAVFFYLWHSRSNFSVWIVPWWENNLNIIDSVMGFFC